MGTPRPSTERDHRERILRVLVHLQEHLDEALDVEALAGVAHLSPFHFHRVFRALVGETAMEHVRRLRLERAARRLAYTDDPVVQVAFSAGYEAHEAFTRAFAAALGLPPVEYRRQRRAALSPNDEPPIPALRAARLGSGPAVEVRSRGVTRVVFARHVGPYDQVGEAFARLYAFGGPRGLLGQPPFGLVYDDPDVTAPERFRYDACLVAGDAIAAEGAIGVQVVTGGEFAVALHRGPYHRLGETYGHVLAVWAPSACRVIAAGPSLERYLDDPGTTAPDQLRTEVWLRLEEPWA
jgi:AraC family transcriptional regulator